MVNTISCLSNYTCICPRCNVYTCLLGAKSLGTILSMITFSLALCSQGVNVKRMFVPLVLFCTTLASSTIVSAHVLMPISLAPIFAINILEGEFNA